MTDFEEDLVHTRSSMRHLMRWFLASSFLVLGGVGGWSAVAEVDSAVVTAGSFMPQSNAQAVQHLEGGVVGAILVREGDQVEAGQVLVRLDAAKVIAETSIEERRLVSLIAEKARLEAERAGWNLIRRPDRPLGSAAAEDALRVALAAEQAILTERLFSRESQLSQLLERKRQIEMQIDGLTQRIRAIREEYEQAAAELEDRRFLDRKGLIRRPVLRQSERDVSRLRGDIGDTEARIAGAKSQLTETELKIAEHARAAHSEILTRLHDVEARLAETDEQATAARDRLSRLEIRAPRTGRVHQLAVHTVGGVVTPGQTLMSIIPSDEPLVVSARIAPGEVDQVRIGQDATVRIASFHLPEAPELDGTVASVSPDQVVDSRSGQAFFEIKVAVAPGERAKLGGYDLTPGLPAEVFVRGESRRVITYLTRPLTEKLELAFREE
ncbi:HlyD family type I secretion periplasmic adaptor subunit [Chthonobacter rhizosphaerae]|uniref:HlyD family type I secretion periplasmic adaptor subunit n=1 Tax=Chthonobacter rhizosphaerae TaxID=2735553 RepID=UPI0015EF7A53|nr:HlyD family type I secretion periplasmic adaptor subunit [Chthonobacter rhizosphaerae]